MNFPCPVKHFGSSGDLGDCLHLLPIIQQLGGKHMLWLYDRPFTKVISTRFHLLEPLLMAQSYIEATAVSNGDGVDYDLSTFRSRYVPTRTLLASHADWGNKQYGLPIPTGETKWLDSPKSKASKGRVVIARSPRYHNPYFPWAQVVEHYGDALMFVGLKEEYEAFCSAFGQVEHVATENLLDVAKLIAGSDLFIGNQSSPFAVAEGLKHLRILETNLNVPDCIYPGSTNCQHVADGSVTLPAVAGKPEKHLSSRFSGFRDLNKQETPPGSWQYPGLISQYNFIAMRGQLVQRDRISVDEATHLIYTYNCNRLPDHFRRRDGDNLFAKVKQAKRNAGLI